ncbi:MAG: twin-arginine translocase subunit TatC, partial [Pirellulales bacterium]
MPQPHEQDLFESSTMSFGDHLEELRSCLIKALLWVVVGTCVGLFFGDYVVNLIKLPLQDSLGKYYIETSLLKFKEFSKSQQKRNLPVQYDESQITSLVDGGYIFEVISIYPPAVLGNLQSQYPDAFPPPATSSDSSPESSDEEGDDGQAKPKLTG